jgi:hypothetical protein
MGQEQRITNPCPASTAPEPPAPSPAAKPRRGGAPARNQNRTTHSIFGIGLPSGTSHIAGRLNALRRELGRLVEARHGDVSLYHAAVIDGAVKWERLAQLAGRWLRKEGEKLSPQEKLSFAEKIAKAAVERNRAIATLGLDRSIADAFDPADTYRRPLPPYRPQTPQERDTREFDASDDAFVEPPAADASNSPVGDAPH